MALSRLAVCRLTKLADFMRALRLKKNEQFDMGCAYVDPYHCGFRACAGGWALKVPSFRRAGLLEINHSDVLASFFDLPKGGYALNTLFNVDYDPTAAKLETPKQWATHCRRFLKENA